MEVIMELNFEPKLEILPDEAKRDLLKFYEFKKNGLVIKLKIKILSNKL